MGPPFTLQRKVSSLSAEDLDRGRLELALGIARGMQRIHKLGFVHCDLKPGNVLLTKVREGPFCVHH
jgi:serine/threonine protein kinase